ncbi:MAG: hypothetical protein ACRCVI_03060 [Mycoplasmoidaceae bacterium]
MSLNQFAVLISGKESVQAYFWIKVDGKNETLLSLREKRMRELGTLD